MFILLALYDIATVVIFLFALPKILWDYVFRSKYRSVLVEKLGLRMPQLKPSDKPLIWVHAVSLGEFKAVSYLLHIWRKELPQLRLFVTHGTLTGYKQAEKEFGNHLEHAMLPIDLPFNSKRLIKSLKPKALIHVESDLWPGYLLRAKKSGCQCYVINAKFSDKSAQRMLSFKQLTKPLLIDPIDLFCLKSVHEERFLKQIGASHFEVTGNIKWDHPYPTPDSMNLAALRQRLCLSASNKLVVAASTHSGEELAILESLKKDLLAGKFQLVIVPRHPERFRRVLTLVKSMGFHAFAYSEASTVTNEAKKRAQVIIIDTMGMMLECYALSQCALVGGSWEPIGGHNILEPLAMGIATFYGPYMHNQKEMHEMATLYNAASQISIYEISEAVEKTIAMKSGLDERRKNAEKMLASCSGSVKRTDMLLRNSWKEKGIL